MKIKLLEWIKGKVHGLSESIKGRERHEWTRVG